MKDRIKYIEEEEIENNKRKINEIKVSHESH